MIVYSVGVQTSPSRQEGSDDEDRESDTEPLPSGGHTTRAQKRLSRRERDQEEEVRRNLRREIEDELKAVRDPNSEDQAVSASQPRLPARVLNNDEANAVTASSEFLDFVDRSSKVIERALDEEYDVLADYALDGLEEVDDDEDEGYASSRGPKGKRLKEIAQFFDERWSKKRMISDINFSPKASLYVQCAHYIY